jgi:hypothetical protein
MPTRKQRKRAQKERRHEYETVWVDSEGNELEEPPEDAAEPVRESRANGKKVPQKRPQQRSSAGARTPLPPSWRRAVRRSLMLGGAVFVVMYLLNSKATGINRVSSAAALAVLYTALFIPFTYYVDRFAFRRWERRAAGQAKKR